MARRTENKQDALPVDVRRQLRSEQMKRFIRSLPAFSVDLEMPDRLTKLLRKLDRAGALGPSRKQHN